jgi:hypothetical protein
VVVVVAYKIYNRYIYYCRIETNGEFCLDAVQHERWTDGYYIPVLDLSFDATGVIYENQHDEVYI